MARRKKRKKRTERTLTHKMRPRGFDYGCLPHVVALSSIEFPGHLSAASVDAVVYGEDWSDAIGHPVPTISLAAQRGDELAKAFEEFNAWSQMTDPDSVEITFVFRKSGGYLLAISVDRLRLERRCLGFDRAHATLIMAPMWVKTLDSVQPVLREFVHYFSRPVAPYLFNGVTYIGPRSVLLPMSRPDVRPIGGLKPLLKFEVTCVDEDDVAPYSSAWMALNVGSHKARNLQKPRSKPTPHDIARQRAKTLRCHFPVTLERVRKNSYVRHLILQLATSDVRLWQIEQALCNLVLSADMGHGAHFVGLSARKAQKGIVKVITTRYESADGPPLLRFTREDIRTQIVADGNALLQYLKKKRRRDLNGVQAALNSESVLEAPTAVDPPPEWSAS